MVRVEGWVARSATRVTFSVPAVAAQAAMEILTRYVPPRLARSTDRSAEAGVLRVAGPRALAIAATAGLPLPATPGGVLTATAFGRTFDVAQPGEAGPPPFALQIAATRDTLQHVGTRLAAAGARPAPAAILELSRVLAGWPSVGAEVDDKALPQEIRFDEVGGVSYTKGCYTGQETVSRLHFRGHANRTLRGLVFDGVPDGAPSTTVLYQDRDVGMLTSLAWQPQGGGPDRGRWIGLAVLRREVTPGAMVRTMAVDARVVDLPFEATHVIPA